MTNYIVAGVLALILIGAVIGAYIWGKNSVPDVPIPTETHYHITTPATIVQQIDPQTGEQYEYASMDTTLVSEDGTAEVTLGIGYNEASNVFDLAASIRTTPLPPPKPPLFRPTAGVGIGFKDGLKSADVEAGVVIRNQYSIRGWADTQGTVGVRFGVIF